MRNKNKDSPQPKSLSGGWTISEVSEQDRPREINQTTPESADESDVVLQEQRSGLLLLVLGVFGGIYLIYSLGWIEIAKAYSPLNEVAASSSGSVGAIFQNLFFWVAPLAPISWYIVSITLTKRLSTLGPLVLMLIGAVVLFPYPFVFAGGSAQ